MQSALSKYQCIKKFSPLNLEVTLKQKWNLFLSMLIYYTYFRKPAISSRKLSKVWKKLFILISIYIATHLTSYSEQLIAGNINTKHIIKHNTGSSSETEIDC